MNKFKQFQKSFLRYQQLFGVTGYKVYFKYEPLDACFADITANQDNMIATVRLNNKLETGEKQFEHIERSAKHEALHLLLWKLEERAVDRYIKDGDIGESVEEIVFKLEELIPDIKGKK